MFRLFPMSNEKKLDLCAERGLVTIGKVIGFETARTYELERDGWNKEVQKRYKITPSDVAVSIYKSVPDNRVSYKPVIRYKANGSVYSKLYHTYINERKMSLKDGDSVRIIFNPNDPSVFIILGDETSYYMLDMFLRR